VSAELLEVQANISIATEFVDGALNASAVLLKEAPQVQILADLDAREAEEFKKAAYEKKLHSILEAGKKVGLLQLGEKSLLSERSKPEDLVQDLLHGWDDVVARQQESLATLNASFVQELAQLSARKDELLQAQGELLGVKAAEDAVHAKLTDAVQYLEKIDASLVEQRAALQNFTQRLGGRSLPGEATSKKLRARVNTGKHSGASWVSSFIRGS